MKDITLALREDHKQIRRLLHRLTWEMDKHRWRERVDELARILTAHLDAEDEAVYGPLLQSKTEHFVALHSELEHIEIKKCLKHLQAAEADTTPAIENFAGLRYLFVEHISEEEEGLFPLLAELFDEEKLDDMYREYCDARARIHSEWVAMEPTNTSSRALGESHQSFKRIG